ncbi:MAG: DUF4340 domain-containing protein [Planctomycetaceae bacterium]|nr:DUF4340 domain-containing protein [Planctomycetaceae bacterium]
MNPLTRTLTYVAVAGISIVAASSAWYASRPSTVAGYGDVGQDFFGDFTDPTKAAALSVVDFDEQTRDVQSFSVKQNDDGLWVIPSHHDYPAEAADRLAKSATSLLGLKKVAVQSRSKDDWKSYGVVDPEAEGAATAAERGTRITLRDGSGNALVDLIVGNEVDGRDGHYYVREPEKNTTYITRLNPDLSAKFSDWIEPDLLKVTQSEIVSITIDNYSIDEQRGTVDKKELLNFERKGLASSADWTLKGLDDNQEELDQSPIRDIAQNLDQLKIVGVRPKPEGLDDNLNVNPLIKQVLQQQMQAQGYFIGADREGKERLYSNEGELIAGVNNGVEYTLYFGEIARGSGRDIEVGLGEQKADSSDADKTADAADSESSDSEDGPRRYLLVRVGFNEELLGPKPSPPTEPQMPEILKQKDADSGDKDGESKSADEKPAKDKPVESAKSESDGDKNDSDESDRSVEDNCSPQDEDTAKEEPKTESEVAEKAEEPAKSEETTPADSKKEDSESETKDSAAKSDATDASKADADKSEEKKEPEKDPKQIAQEEYDAAMGKYEAEKKAYEQDLTKYDSKVKEGKEKVNELSRRFAGWYYVITADSFEKFKIERKDVVSKKESEKKDDESTEAEKKQEAAK